MQQHRQFSCDGHDGSFLRVAFPSDRQCLAESSQVAVLSERPQDVLRRLDQKAAQYILGPFGEDCDLRRFGQALSVRGERNAKKRAVVAVARKLAMLLHRLWRTGEVYEPFHKAPTAHDAAAAA